MFTLIRWLVIRYFERAQLRLDGLRSYDVKVEPAKLDAFYARLVLARLRGRQSLAFGQMYMAGWWSCRDMPEMFIHLLCTQSRKSRRFLRMMRWLADLLVNPQSVRRSRRVVERHYDAGGIEFFRKILGGLLVYSCGFWTRGGALEKAQRTKIDYTLRKAKIKPGGTLLDIGCGFGELLRRAAQLYDVQATGISISRDQLIVAGQLCHGLDASPVYCDWRHADGQYDRIVSVGMIEHVGPRNYGAFLAKLARLLKLEGIAVLHFIVGSGDPDAFIDRYIFPGGVLVPLPEFLRAAGRYFTVVDLEHIHGHYATTLAAWRERLWRYKRELQELDPQKYMDEFFLMYDFYLSSAEALDCIGHMHVVQVVLMHRDCKVPYGAIIRDA